MATLRSVVSGFALDGSDGELPQQLAKQPRGSGRDRTTSVAQLPELHSPSINLLPSRLAARLRAEMNNRLDMARDASVPLTELIIGDDCLPTWPGFHRDPAQQSLAEAIREALLDYDLAKSLGSMVQERIIRHGNRKIHEAIALGLGLDAIYVGESLMPEWNSDESDTEEGNGDDNSCAQSYALGMREGCGVSEISERMSTSEDTCTPPDDTQEAMSLFSSDSDSDMEIEMSNFVCPDPIYEELDAINVVHDVEVYDGTDRQGCVEVEVYLASGDDCDFEALPELELAIDRDGYEHYFGDEHAVDLYIPDAGIYCFSGIEEREFDDESDEIARNAAANTGAAESGTESQGDRDIIDVVTRHQEPSSDESRETSDGE